MAKKPDPSVKAKPETNHKTPTYLPWPTHVNDIAKSPRLFRIERLNAFEWQVFVTDEDGEQPIGKPDLFDILRNRINLVMKAEGQRRFLEEKTKSAKAQVPANATK